ncbi:MAG: AI-2E family transporter [Vicinamibacterales bacterium]
MPGDQTGLDLFMLSMATPVNGQPEPRLRFTASRAAVATTAAAAILSALALLALLAQVWLLVFAGLLLAVLLGAAADAVSRGTGLSRGLALTLVLVILVVALGLAGRFLWPSVAEQADELATRLPAAWSELRDWIDDRPIGEWLLGRADPGQVIAPANVVNQATGALMTSATAIGGVLVVLFVGLYVAAEPSLYRGGVRRLLPPAAHPGFDEVSRELGRVLRWWLVGKLLSMSIVGVMTTVGLWLLGVPLALVFGLLAAALTFVPNIGPVLSVVPPALLALVDEPRVAAYVLGLYLGIQTVESYAITPIIQRRTVSLPPALTITAQVALGLLVGALGVAVATPLTAAAMTVVRVLYLERVGRAD